MQVVLLLCVCAVALVAQQPVLHEGDVLDRIEAIAGGEPILKSEVDAQLLLLAQQNPSLKFDDAELRKRVLDALINERLLFVQAQLDSITVSDDEVNAQLDATIAQLVRQAGSEERLESIYQMPMWKIRRDGREEIRKRMIVQRYQQLKLGDVKVSPREVEEFYEQYRDSLPVIGK